MITPDIGELLEDLRESREEILADPDIPEEERKDGDSVLVTLNSSYKRLRQLDAQAAEFFPLLALFPAGIGDEGLREVFGRERARLIRPIVDRALVETAPPFGYYYLPTPVRSYAERKLPEAVMDRVAPRALPYLAKRVEAYDALITKGQHASGILCFASELPNLERFFGWGYERESALEEPPICHSARGTAGLRNFFVTTDPGGKQVWRYEKGLGAARRLGDRLGEANCLDAIGDVQSFRNENDEALASYRQALGLFRGIGERLGEANCLKAIGDVQSFRNENDEALASYRQALELFRGIGDRLGEANCLKAIGDVQEARGEGQEAFSSYREALGIYGEIGDPLGAANTLSAIGKLLLVTEAEEKGVDLLNQALAIYQEIGDRAGQANVGIALANYHAGKGGLDKAIEHLQPVADFGKSIGHSLGEEHQAQIDAWRQALAKGEGQAAAGDG